MNITVHAKDLVVTEAIREFIDKQLQKVERLGVPIQKIQVYLEYIERKDTEDNRATVKIAAGTLGKKDVTVKEHSHDLYKAISKASQSLLRHIRKAKEKKVDIIRRKQIATVKEMEE